MITLVLIPSLYIVVGYIRHNIFQKKRSSERLAPKFQIQAKISIETIESATQKPDLEISFFVFSLYNRVVIIA